MSQVILSLYFVALNFLENIYRAKPRKWNVLQHILFPVLRSGSFVDAGLGQHDDDKKEVKKVEGSLLVSLFLTSIAGF